MQEGEKKYGPNLTLPFRDFGGEKLLQFIWQFGYFNNTALTTVEGENLIIVFPGTLNKNSGPDFTAAKIKIGDTIFFGNIELHLKTSDWEKHHHQQDPQYNNVILHVVFQHDKKLLHNIPVLELEPRISNLLLERYNALMNADSFIPCSASIASVKELTWVSWKERLLVERLARKSKYILTLLAESNNHWEETLWWLLARNFGMKVNADAFEAIAKSIPFNVLAKHRSSLHQLEALLFGQAGLLDGKFQELYPKMLKSEYQHLQQKFSLTPISFPLQFLRMRPVNFPTLRLAQLAALVQGLQHLFSKIVEAMDLIKVKAQFQVKASNFWNVHYTLQRLSPFREKALGTDTIDNTVINTVAPILFAYGVHHKEEQHKLKALRWLEEVGTEKNAVMKGFDGLGIKSKTAYDSQALIELKNEYCSHKKCLQCSVGNNILKREAVQPANSSCEQASPDS